jgi:hypothetical protein
MDKLYFILVLLFPYILLSLRILIKKRHGFDKHDKAGIAGAMVSLILMTTALILFPRIHTMLTGDHSANIGAVFLFLGSPIYCYAFIVIGYWIGRAISMLKVKREVTGA